MMCGISRNSVAQLALTGRQFLTSAESKAGSISSRASLPSRPSSLTTWFKCTRFQGAQNSSPPSPDRPFRPQRPCSRPLTQVCLHLSCLLVRPFWRLSGLSSWPFQSHGLRSTAANTLTFRISSAGWEILCSKFRKKREGKERKDAEGREEGGKYSIWHNTRPTSKRISWAWTLEFSFSSPLSFLQRKNKFWRHFSSSLTFAPPLLTMPQVQHVEELSSAFKGHLPSRDTYALWGPSWRSHRCPPGMQRMRERR